MWSFIDSGPRVVPCFVLDLIQCIRFRKWYLQHVPKNILLEYQSASSNFSKVGGLVFYCRVTHHHKLNQVIIPVAVG